LGDTGSTVLCCHFGHEDGKCYTGTLNGEVYIWEDNKLVRVEKAHKGPVYAVNPFEGGFLTGGKDGILKVWNKDFKLLHNIPMGKYNLRSLDWDKGKILVGTKSSEIFEITYSGENSQAQLLIEGHGEGELWGLGVHPTKRIFATASDDKLVKVWDGATHTCMLTIPVKFEARSCGFSPDGNSLAVGYINGSFSIFDAKDGREIVTKKERKEALQQVVYSPNGRFLAVGSHDNFVDIYETTNYTRAGVCSGSSSYITQLDWSADSKYIQTNSGAYEVLYYEIPSCNRITSPPKSEWATWTCVLGKTVEGIWPPYSDKTDVNSLDRNKDATLIVTGDDFGFVKLFNYPCPKGTNHKKFQGHSAHVTQVRWSADNTYVISTGGGDQAVFQWRVVTDKADDHAHSDVDEKLDSDVERETEIDYSRPNKEKASEPDADASRDQPLSTPVASGGGLFSMEESMDTVHSGRPGLAAARPKTVAGGKPKSGESLSGYTDPTPAPDKDLHLDFVHGYRSWDTRNNIYYNVNGEVVYHTAAVGISYQKEKHVQRFFKDHHDDDIVCMAMHPNGKFVATGQVGKDPKICVWDSTTMEKVVTLQGAHERGIAALDFSPNGQLLVSVGLDNDHTIVVWNWQKGTKLSSDKGSQDKIMVCVFNPFEENAFATCGVKHIKFWKAAGNGLVNKRGIFGNAGAPQTMLDITFDEKFCYSAANDGQLYQWSDNTLVTTIKAHEGPVFALASVKEGLLTGGKDQKIIMWGPGLKAIRTFEVGAYVIRGICAKGDKMLIGTIDGSILECNTAANSTPKALVQGHGMGEVWGLATHPSEQKYATASDDKTLRIWDAPSRKQIAKKDLTRAARSVAYSPDGSLIAIGYINGSFSVHKTDSLDEVVSKKDRKEAIHEIKFSPNGKLLAVGSHDNFVDLYEVDGWKRCGRCSDNSSYITHLDFAANGELLVTNSGDYQQLFYQPPTGKRITVSKASEKSIEWATWTGVLGDNVAGIWPKGSDGTDINSTDRSHSRDVIATGDDFGHVKLFKFPAPVGAVPREYKGHSSHVTTVRFTAGDKYLISTGGLDAAVFQWKVVDSKHVEEVVDEHYDSDIEREKSVEYIPRSEKAPPIEPTSAAPEPTEASPFPGGGLFQMETTVEVVHAARPGAAPKKAPAVNDDLRFQDESHSNLPALQLEYVHGYRAHDARDNVWYTPSGEIVYHTAAVGVVLNPKTNTQRHFLEHTDDIVSLDYHPETDMVATGQVGKTPTICVWDSKTCSTQSIIKGFHTVAVSSLSFSKDGKILVSVGMDNDHSVAVWKWKTGTKLASAKGAQDMIFDVVFNPFKDTEFVTVGVKHIQFWTYAGTNIDSKRGIFGDVGPIQTMLTVTFSENNKVYSGAASGEIYEWEGNTLKRVIKGHEGPCFTINKTDSGEFLSGGKDGKVLVWPANMSAPKDTIEVPKPITGKPAVIRSVTRGAQGILVGTITSEIYSIDSSKKATLLVNGHADGELWGMATHPQKRIFATAGDDRTLRLWDMDKRAMTACIYLPQLARSVEFAPDGKTLAVGFSNGGFSIYDAASLKELAHKRNRKEAIHEIKFSPDGKTIAIGSHDNFVDLYSTADLKMLGTCKGNSSYITHIDFSKDGTLLQTNSGAYEHLLCKKAHFIFTRSPSFTLSLSLSFSLANTFPFVLLQMMPQPASKSWIEPSLPR
jgi:microtubule-associated protein-like 6